MHIKKQLFQYDKPIEIVVSLNVLIKTNYYIIEIMNNYVVFVYLIFNSLYMLVSKLLNDSILNNLKVILIQSYVYLSQKNLNLFHSYLSNI